LYSVSLFVITLWLLTVVGVYYFGYNSIYG